MKKELIEGAADSYAAIARPSFVNGEFDRNAMAQAFEYGADWRINAAWHDAMKEVPEKFKPILVIHDDLRFSVNMVGGYMRKCPSDWVRFAYVEDLTPEKKGGEQ